MRGNLLDVLRQPYIEAARAKGVPGHKVVLKHAVPNALHPLVMYQGVAMPYMLSGELEVAIVLGIPTIGPLMLDSLYRNDVWVTTTIFLWLSAVLVVANLLADIAARPDRSAHPPGGCDMNAILRRPTMLDTTRTAADPTWRRRMAPPDGEPQPPHGADALIADAAAPALARGQVADLSQAGLAALPPQHDGHDRRGRSSALLLLVTVFADFLSPYDPTARNPDAIYIAAAGAPLLRRRRLPSDPLHQSDDDRDRPDDLRGGHQDRHRDALPARLPRPRLVLHRSSACSFDRHLLAAPAGCPWNIVGTDRDGRDVLSRLLVGSQLTMSIALIVVSVVVALGTLVGMISGYLGGLADHWIQRGVEFFLAVPEVPFYFALVAIVPRNLSPFQLVLVICAILSTSDGRIWRARCAARRCRSRSSTTSPRPKRSAPAAGASSSTTSCRT